MAIEDYQGIDSFWTCFELFKARFFRVLGEFFGERLENYLIILEWILPSSIQIQKSRFSGLNSILPDGFISYLDDRAYGKLEIGD